MTKKEITQSKEKSTNQLIRESGLKATGSRSRILRVLSNAKKPLRIKDIYERAQNPEEEMNMVTIYRTIETFAKKGLVRRVDFGEDAAYYEIHDSKHHHHYITCTKCKRHDCVDTCAYNNSEPDIQSKLPNYDTVSYHSVGYFGVCTACTEKLGDKLQKVLSNEI
jgi:Fur family ferric uptake transcriptional regulator